MRRGVLWKISVRTTAEAEDAVAETLSRWFETTPNLHTDLRTGIISVSVFAEQKPAGLSQWRHRWKLRVAELRTFGLNAGKAPLKVSPIPRENWAESWKRHFKPLEIGRSLLLKPSWLKRKPKRGQALVVLDPGLSFGTGHHPTTAFCLRQLVRMRKPEQTKSVLDIGTGTGILAIAAAKLGYSPISALDNDPAAVRTALANAHKNRVKEKLHVKRQDLTRLQSRPVGRYDIVFANLISTLLIAEKLRITAQTKPGGTLVLAGILNKEFQCVQSAFEQLGFRLVARKCEKEWTSGAFTKT